ncbi:MAG: TauD/TfdA family dioxygenase, partial [Pseudomonadota bacterium]|nr:TauD/TfdA family dioxygenase [Pseudomonadota bacterium]
MGLNIRRISDALGAEISGVDLREPAGEATKSEFRQALLDHHLIVVPGQQLSDLQHKQFCEFFGEIHAERTVPDRESDEIVGMLRVSNFHEDGILPNGEMWFH